MKYRFVTEKQNYEDLAAGRVILTKSGSTSFPVRLASEIFQRCAELFSDNKKLHVYDPCCGGGYLLTVLGFLHHQRIKALWGADIDYDAVMLAEDNLSLLSQVGLKTRQDAIQTMFDSYQKDSHREALESVRKLQKALPEIAISTGVYCTDALYASLKQACVDVLITDVPYGDLMTWQGDVSDNPVYHLLEAQSSALVEGGIAAIVSDQKQKIAPPTFQRLFRDKLGKRHVILLQKTD